MKISGPEFCCLALTSYIFGIIIISMTKNNYKQLLDDVFVISRIIKVEVGVIPSGLADNPYRDLDYHKNRL